MLPESVFAWPVMMRHFNIADAPRVQELAGDRAVSDTTAVIPHPYPDGMAEEWIDKLPAQRALGSEYIYAITRAEDRVLVGAIASPHRRSARTSALDRTRYWGNGYATAAARADRARVQVLDCQRITASHLVRNAASGPSWKNAAWSSSAANRAPCADAPKRSMCAV
jgi:RimJ/RimL family protein N-acetyltransferase